MTELAKDLEYEALRTHHRVLRYSPEVFPIDQNIFGIMQQLNRLVVVRTPQDWDELKFVDPRRLAYYIGKDYVKDEFIKLTRVNEKNVCRLGIVHVNG